jgi:parallel beta-helix repeat protein
VLNVHAKSANGYNIVAFPGGDDMLVQGCYSEDARDEGIEFQGTSRCQAIGNKVVNAGKNGILVWAAGGSADGCVIAGNTVTGSAALTAGFCGIRIDDGTTNVTVTGNTVIGGGTSARGISISSATAAYVVGAVVSGNAVTGSPTDGIYVYKAKSVTVHGNSVNGCETGIKADTDIAGIVISGNTITGCQRSGILIFDVSDFTITGNLCKNNGIDAAQTYYRAGITLFNSGGGIDRGAVIGNRCYDDQVTKTQQYGIRTVNTIGASVVIAQNITNGNATTGQDFVFGGATAASSPPWKLLPNVSVTSTGTSVPHGLPYAPTSVLVYMRSAGTIWRSGTPDATNVGLIADAGTRTCDVWVG